MARVAKKMGLLACAMLTLAAAAQPRPLQGFHHETWGAEQGVGAVFDVQQAPDGYLWLTTARGIYRFDGVHFASLETATGGAAHSRDIDSMYAASDGGIWMVTRGQGLLLWKDGKLADFPDRRCTPGRKLDSLVQDQDGAVWVLSSGGLFRLSHGVCSEIGKEHGYPGGFAKAFLMDHTGTLWVKMPTGQLYFLRRDAPKFETSPRGLGPIADFNYLHEAPDGSVWLSDAVGLRRVSGGPLNPSAKAPPPSGRKDAHFGNFAFSPDGTLWTTVDNGIVRFRNVQGLPLDVSIRESDGETFTTSDGLSSNVVSKLMTDREGTLWLATNGGLDQLRPNAIGRLLLPPLPDYQIGIATDNDGAVWLGNLGQPLTRVGTDRSMKVYPPTTEGRLVRRDFTGAIWSSGRGGVKLWRESGGRLEPVHYPTDNIEMPAAVALDKNHELWVSSYGPSMFHRVGDLWHNEDKVLARKPGVIGTMLGDDAGNVWFAFSNLLVQWDGKSFKRYTLKGPQLAISVTTLSVRGGHVWMGGSGGIVLFHDGVFARLRCQDDDMLGRVSGLAETAGGELWANGFSGVTRITAPELARWLKDPGYAVRAEHFDVLDGLPGLSQERFPEPTMAEGPNGRLYFATNKGVGWVDPSALDAQRNSIAPPVVIEQVIAGGESFSATHPLAFPAHTDHVELRYTALSLAIPERVRFRYKLDGIDKDWQDAGTRREAFYNSLPPGRYRFRVIACNNDGVWNETGASLAFSIAPSFFQSMWFSLLCGLLFLGLLYVIYLLRVRQITAQMRRRMDERAGERVRIARELHDTLLQTIHALILRFHYAVEALPESEPARALLVQSLARADDAIVETRQRVQDLRSAAMHSLPFAEMLERIADDFRTEDLPAFRVIVEGSAPPFAPLVQDELCHIAQEAMANGFRHAEASEVEVELSYGLTAFRMIYRDNGQGIEPEVLASGGRDGHWGLVGMRERARLIGAEFEIKSALGGGTEIVVKIPATRAYAGRNTASLGLRTLVSLFYRWRSSK